MYRNRLPPGARLGRSKLTAQLRSCPGGASYRLYPPHVLYACQMLQRRFAGRMAGNSGGVDITRAFLVVQDVPLFFEHTKLRPHGRIVGLAGQLRHHLRGSRASAPVEDVHDLAFAAAQGRVC